MNDATYKTIKRNIKLRCSVAVNSGIGLSTRDKEEMYLLNEVERLTKKLNATKRNLTLKEKILDDLWKFLCDSYKQYLPEYNRAIEDIKNKYKELLEG